MKNYVPQRCLDRDFNTLSIGSDPHGITITYDDWTSFGSYSSVLPSLFASLLFIKPRQIISELLRNKPEVYP